MISFESAQTLGQARLVSRQLTFTQIPARPDRWLCCSAGMELSEEVQSSTVAVLNFLDGKNSLLEAIQLANVSPENIERDVRSMLSLGMLAFQTEE